MIMNVFIDICRRFLTFSDLCYDLEHIHTPFAPVLPARLEVPGALPLEDRRPFQLRFSWGLALFSHLYVVPRRSSGYLIVPTELFRSGYN